MKTSLLAVSLAAFVLGTSSLSAMAADTSKSDKLLGSTASPAEADMGIVLSDRTRSVHVERGDVVKFTSGAQTFAVRFDGTTEIVPLSKFAPPNTLTHEVSVYVGPQTKYSLPNP